MRGLMGSFAIMPLPDLVEYLARRRITGSVTCERGSIRKTVQLEDGAAVATTSNDPREHLGQLLLNYGHVTEEQLAKAFETQQATKVRLGKVLAMVGVVSPDVVRQMLVLQIREVLLDAFLWDAGVFRVDDEPRVPVAEVEARVPLDEIVREAEFRSAAWRAFRAQFPTGTATLRLDEARIPPDLVRGGVDDRLLAFAREGRSIDEIGIALHSTHFHLYQRLYALARQGIVSAVPPRSGDEGAAAADAGHDDARRLRPLLLDPPRTPRLRVPAHEIALMRLSAAEKYLLGRCDGTRDVRQILQVAPLGEAEVLGAIQRFVDARIVEVA